MYVLGQLLKAQLEVLGSDPTPVSTGLIYFSTVSLAPKVYNGTGWKTLVDTDTAQVLTLKDYDGGTASNTSRITIPKAGTATLAALTRKAGTIVFDTDLLVHKSDDGTNLNTLASSSLSDSIMDIQNLALSTSVGSNALTIALKDKAGSDPSGSSTVKIGFRNSTLTTGTYAIRTVSAALSLVISSGSTLGHISATPDYIYVYALDNAGTVELAVSSILLDEGGVYSSTAEGGAGAADSRTVLYSTTARSNVAIRLIGRLKSTQTTAGTWAAVPTETVAGGNFIEPAMNDIHATKLGMKTYSHGTTYNGGNAPTITLSSGGGSLSAVVQGDFIPVQRQDGTWWCYLSIDVGVSSTARTGLGLNINGITFYNNTGSGQALTGFNTNGVVPTDWCIANSNASTLSIDHSSGTTTEYIFTGCVRLNSKPTWAY